MSEGFWTGRDGGNYKTWSEKEAANARWDQQQTQNKLLEEQNRLLRQQEYERERKIKMEREKEEKEQKGKSYLSFLENVTIPRMLKAGIKSPAEYLKKLIELYGSKPVTLELIDKESTEIIEDEEYPYEMLSKINEINMFNRQLENPMELKKEQRKFFIKIMLVISIIEGVILSIATKEVVWGCGFAAVTFVFELILMPFLIKSQSLEDTKKARIDAIDSLNAEIEELNNSRGLKEWENRIKNFEQKRLQNFNYLLEFELEEFGELVTELYNLPDVKLRFNSYPTDYEQKKKEYYEKMENEIKEKERTKAVENGTDIFEDL